MLGRLRELQDYMYYFQFTLNPYGPEVEPRVPSKQHTLIPAFQRLAETLGPDRVIWRYDPIFLSETYSEAYHLHYFEILARRLAPYTRHCTISFIDYYRGTEKAMRGVAAKPLTPPALLRLARGLADIARAYGLSLDTCAEEADLSAFGIEHARCVDGALLSRLLGTELRVSKDKNQRQPAVARKALTLEPTIAARTAVYTAMPADMGQPLRKTMPVITRLPRC